MKITTKKFSALQKKTQSKRGQLRDKKRKLQDKISAAAKVKADLSKEKAKGKKSSKATITRLERKQGILNQKTQNIREQIGNLEIDISKIVDDLLFSTDPRDQVAMLDDDYPVFLMPVRVETRFMTIKHIARVDRNKVASNSNAPLTVIDGRPTQVPRPHAVADLFDGVQEVPAIDDASELWIRIFPDDLAVHTHEASLTEKEIQAGQEFWKHIWYASNDEALRIGAWRGLVGGRGPERAAWVAKQMKPTNPQDQPAAPVNKDDDLPIAPQFSTPSTKEQSWTQPPHSKVMPDRFVVRLYNGNNYREVVGEKVPDDLQLGIDPMASEMEIENEAGLLVLKEKIKWLQDFEEAEKVGMAIRVPINIFEEIFGFSKILVLGVKTSADKDEGKALLEELLDNHHYTHGGLSLIPQGTPTNNTEDAKSGYTAFNTNEEDLFDIELGEGLFNPTSNDQIKTDGQHLADALGISPNVLQNIRHADQTDVKEAMCMNRALWPTTFGYYLPQMMHPVFSENEIDLAQSHFKQYVLGRGRVPAIRVDSQPYGILPTTAFSKWKEKRKSSQGQFLDKMYNNVLKHMETTWDRLAQKVKSADPSAHQGNVEKFFLDVIGLHASSVEYYQRFVTGPFMLWNLHNYSSIIKGTYAGPSNASYASSLDFFQLFGSENFLYVFPPRLFDFFYSRDHKFLNGPVVDPLKLSETRTLKPIGSQEENYIDWLIKSNWTQIKAENYSNIGAPQGIPPNSLLYLMLRHSTLMQYTRTGLQLLVNQGIIADNVKLDTEFQNLQFTENINVELTKMVRSQATFREGMRMEKSLDKKVEKEMEKKASKGMLDGMSIEEIQKESQKVKDALKEKAMPKLQENIKAATGNLLETLNTSISRNELLFESTEFFEGLSIAEYLNLDRLKLKKDREFTDIQELVDALKCLKDMPTARLERCFAEHIDLANYRLDAWFYSLVLERLNRLRRRTKTKEGIYLGAYAWLEDLRRGAFHGVHYREVDITPDRIVVPGYKDIALIGDLNVNTNISTIHSWEFKGGISGTINLPQTPINRKTNAERINVKAAPGDTNLAAANFETILPTGGNTLEITELRNQLFLGDPFILNNPVIPDLGPKYIYLGNQEVGQITYDFVNDRFIQAPREDSSNQGYIHAPSINHATTAAVLRAGYETHKQNSASPDDALAINLNSERVRRAMYYLEGVNNGQELGALLGYQFERGLHDRDIGLDAFILNIRLKYPLVAGRVTDNTGATTVETAEAYNVVNGLELVENSRNFSDDYPYGVTGLPGAGTLKNAIIEEVRKLHDALDGINDLLMSEAMHQVVLGNYPKASAVLKAMSGDPLAIDPEVIKTPRNFNILNQRFGLHFDLASNGHSIWTSDGTARSIAEPHLNRWLASLIPHPANIRVNYQYQFIAFDGSLGSVYTDHLTLDNLGLEAIDLYAILSQPSEKGNAVELVNRISFHIKKEVLTADNLDIKVYYDDHNEFTTDQRSLIEIQAIIDQIHEVIGNSRPLRPKDFLLSQNAETVITDNPGSGLDTSLLLSRLQDVIGADMSNGNRGLNGLLTDLDTELINAKAALESSSSEGLNLLSNLRDALINSASFGAQNAIPLSAYEDSETNIQALIEAGNRIFKELEERATQAQEQIDAAILATSEETKSSLLSEAAQSIFGRNFKVFPEYRLYNEGQIDAANNYPDLMDHAGPMAVAEWFQGLSPVRKRVNAYHQMGLLSEALNDNTSLFDFKVTQIPLAPVDDDANPQTRWLGVEFPENYELPDENISFIFLNPSAHSANGLQAGIMFDEWVEEIPDKIAHTGMSVNYNNPNSEPPQVCLLAVSPDLDGKWSWDDLMDTLSETLEWAKKRAVDPDLLNDSIYTQILPATYAAISASDDTPTLDYGRNVIAKPKNGVLGMIRVQDYVVQTPNFQLFNLEE